MNAAFLARMERILWLYAQPHDPRFPVICFDERPCFLIGDAVEPLALSSGKVRKDHYAFEKNGSCALLAAIEPLTGRRFAQVYERRTKREYALFFKDLMTKFPKAEKLRVVQDNLNTHDPSSFYEHLPAPEAFALAQRIEFVYTPKAASWLNMIEIEFSALARQCLNRRIPTLERLRREILQLVKQRDEKRIRIDWQFSITAARSKFKRRYDTVCNQTSSRKGT